MRRVGQLGLALLGTAVACVVVLHLLRPRVSPIERRLSEYVLGPYGWLMDIAFATTAGGLCALALVLARSRCRPRLVPAALVVAAVALVLSAVYRLDATDNVDDAIHRWASGTAAAAVVAAAIGWSVVGIGRPRPWRRGTDRLLALLAFGLAVVSPRLHETFLTGINQRLVWAVLIAWALVVTIAAALSRESAGNGTIVSDDKEAHVIIVGGRFEVDPAERDAFLAERHDVMRTSRGEDGCLEYTFAADPLEPGGVILFERWESQAALDAHLAALSANTTITPRSASIKLYDVTGERSLR